MKDLKIVFMGTPEFGVPILEALIENFTVIGVVTQPDKEVGRKRILTPSPVKVCALEHGIKVFQPIKIRLDYQEIVDLQPDLIVTAAYGQIVGMKLLNSPKYRSINVHGSLLPKYRGGSPIQEAVKNGDKETGITIMYMEKGMDSGDILSQRSIEILDSDNSETMFRKLSLVGRDLLIETIPLLINNQITPIKQDESLVTYAYNISKEDEMVDFNMDAEKIHNKVRAYYPTPAATILLDDEQIKVYETRISKEKHHTEVGKVINVGKDYFTISCGNNTAIDILKLKPAGKNIMSAKDYINGGLKKHLK